MPGRYRRWLSDLGWSSQTSAHNAPGGAAGAAEPVPTSLRQLLIRAMAGSSAVQAGGMIVTFLVGVQLARGLGVEGLGYYGIAFAVIALGSIPGDFGIPKLVTREVAKATSRRDLSTLYGVIHWGTRISLTSSLIVCVAILAGVFLFIDQPLSGVGAAIILGLPFIPMIALGRVRGGALHGLHYIVRGRLPFAFLRPALFSLLLFALFYFRPDAGAAEAMALNSLTAAAALILAYAWLRPRLPDAKPAKLTRHGRDWLRSSIPMALSDGVQLFQAQAAILLLGLLVTATEVGLFRIAVSTMAIVAAPTVLVAAVVPSILARLHAEGDMARLQKLATRCARAQLAGVALLSLPLLAAPEAILSLVFGGEYADAALPLRILVLGQLLNASFGVNAQLLNMTGHERRLTQAMLLGLVVNIAANVLLIPRMGGAGAALATAFSLLTWNLVTWMQAKRLTSVDTSIMPDRRARSVRSQPAGPRGADRQTPPDEQPGP